MDTVKDVVEEINRRIKELQIMEEEFKKKNNVSGRLNSKTKREELQRLKNVILENLEKTKNGFFAKKV